MAHEYIALARSLSAIVMLARVSLAPFTWSEARPFLISSPLDRSVQGLCLGYGMRISLSPPGARSVLVILVTATAGAHHSSTTRAQLLFIAAGPAALRLEQAALSPSADGVAERARLRRELARAPLRPRSSPNADAPLCFRVEHRNGCERISKNTHGARHPQPAHAVAEAIRSRLFPCRRFVFAGRASFVTNSGSCSWRHRPSMTLQWKEGLRPSSASPSRLSTASTLRFGGRSRLHCRPLGTRPRFIVSHRLPNR